MKIMRNLMKLFPTLALSVVIITSAPSESTIQPCSEPLDYIEVLSLRDFH